MRFEDFVDRWWDWVVASSWQLAVLIVLIAVLTRCLPNASPRLRYGLWLLVLLKVFLPPELTAPWSLGQWAVLPVASLFRSAPAGPQYPVFQRLDGLSDNDTVDDAVEGGAPALDRRVIAFAVWFIGVAGIMAVVAVQWIRLRQMLQSASIVDEGPLRIALEKAALEVGLTSAPELVVLHDAPGPFLIGVVKPCIVLPDDMAYAPGSPGLDYVLAHELIHWKHYDTWIGWMQVFVQSLFWFHPFVWWANGQTRHERECVCDDEVLRRTAVTPSEYGESIVQRLTASRRRSPVLGVVGVLEQNSNLQFRLEQIMGYERNRRSFGIVSCAGLFACALLTLPMAPHSKFVLAADDTNKSTLPHPLILSTNPKNGDTDVDPSLKMVTVTFDRDMGTGMSWTGDIPVDRSRKAAWKDSRTCELPVSLEKGKAYRIGINSPSYKNFASKAGEPTPPFAIHFATKGASAEVKQQVVIPKIVALSPANGAKDVDPAIKEIKVTFDVPMGPGMSWVGGGDAFPTVPEGRKAIWSADRLTCVLPVTLKPGHTYKLGINAAKFTNFQSEWKVPAEPVAYTFTTRK